MILQEENRFVQDLIVIMQKIRQVLAIGAAINGEQTHR
jgi:hypothetical protein